MGLGLVCEGASDGCLVRAELEVEMFHGGGGVVLCGDGTLYGLFVDDSCSCSRHLGVVLMSDFISIGYRCGNVWGQMSG